MAARHRALITGVAGFAGSHLAEWLLHCGDEALGCTLDGGWEASSPPQLAERVELVAWDLARPEGPGDEVRRRIEAFAPDWIFHLAALSVPGDCGEGPPDAQALAVNVEGTRRVLQLASALPSQPRVLLTSSSHVYARVSPQAPQIDETAPLGPWRGYGRSKLLAEEELRRATAEGRCDAVIARSFQHAGPRQNSRMMLAEWTRQFVVGDGPVQVQTCDAVIDLCDVRDVVRAYRLLLERGQCGEAYNVGAGRSCRSGDVLETLRLMADPRRPIVERRPGRKQDPIADISKLDACTGWRATIALEQTVADTLAWWREFARRSPDGPSLA